MNGQTSEKRRTPPWGRVMLVAVVALLVAGTGMVLIPRDSGNPPPIPFSETARAEALEDALRLQESAAGLSEGTGQGAGHPGLKAAVTLLTTQARALLAPSEATPSGTAEPSVTSATTTRPTFVEALSASGIKRLADAREADGGIARLLAGVGTAQVLEAAKLARTWQLPIPKEAAATTKVPAATVSGPPCPSASPTPEPTSATTDAALAATVRVHQEAVYAYQVALKRLEPAAAGTAAKGLAAHESLLRQAETLTRANCGDVPASEPGYRLPGQFAQEPAVGLAELESSTLPVLGDLVALSTGETRSWAVDSLLAASRRSLEWGAEIPALPGLTLDAGDLPSLPTPGPESGGPAAFSRLHGFPRS
ncbi:ferritin-like domain-containing protein [Arthrobacter sp. R3-55]